MKKLLPPLIVLISLSIITIIIISISKGSQPITIIKGNVKMEALPLKINLTNDPHCKMIIKKVRNSSQITAPNGNTWFFDDPGCMVLWIEDKSFKNGSKLWVHTLDTHLWVDAKKAWYGVTDKTEMHYGFGAREKKVEHSIDYEEMRLRMLRGENLTDPKIRKKLTGS